MKIDKVGISSKDMKESVKFYELLGFEFEPFEDTSQHVETTNSEGAKLMLDMEDLLVELNGEPTKTSNASAFAIDMESPKNLDNVAEKLREAGYSFKKSPWDAFWGQRYAIVIDPTGYLIDLYAALK